jgi:hypothetical protein
MLQADLPRADVRIKRPDGRAVVKRLSGADAWEDRGHPLDCQVHS